VKKKKTARHKRKKYTLRRRRWFVFYLQSIIEGKNYLKSKYLN
jgi:hypothetical protein